ncbi:MAG: R3H domain-containing nucleic acid-binding protein [Cyanobacteria bacterium P01_G01_bin.67]
MESQISSGKEWLQQLLALMGLAAEVNTEGFETLEVNSDSSWLNIESSNLTPEQKLLLIGGKGESIDAVQYLVNTILNLSSDPNTQSSFIVELDGYRVTRNQELATLTQEAMDKVRATGQEVEISGLSSAERKQIHFLLQNVENIATESRGQEPDRKLIVLPR